MNGGYEKLVVTTYLHERGITFYTTSQIIIMFIKEVHFSRASVCVPLSVMLLIICHSRDCHLIKSVGTKEMHLFKK